MTDFCCLDIKPEDILFATTDSDRIRLVDLGLAHKLRPKENYISEYGSPEFVSPEIVNKTPVTTASDMWSLGTVAYLLLSGRSPFLGETDRDTLLNVQSGRFNFDHYFAGISNEGKDFISKLLKVNPGERMSAEDALSHSWLADRSDQGYVKIDALNLQKYQKSRRQKLVPSVVHKFARFKPLHAAISHPQVRAPITSPFSLIAQVTFFIKTHLECL